MLLVCYLAHGLPLEKRGYTGEGTFYFTGLGSCGEVNEDSDFIAALNAPQMANGANPNHNPICGRKARVTGPKGSVVVKIVDTCPPCQHGDLDLSPGAFEKIADFDDGRVKIDWHWV
ncbi:RlpA-like double-psi beta-barrel-protein domain-containing protein-containing protein [Radiomyces spectabilis]|uniref:RlpA-like double-psi beta-barrel-protein domain-containing protein-containing protein n=1 Tax=Radiomyces spectabilis TaxID=64574 RepID=UPI00221EFDD7|nr:RlpA-like double-psi beta-barrel-protein domain-containing protein-containing protein [Radiomyces spectabilis]KAI8384684.1 RlpA-like double-psi beta-barrel-protein domain-containing protein-containing protein [Radiomyces spectabilis]